MKFLIGFLLLLLTASLVRGFFPPPLPDAEAILQLPNWQHWLGTDSLGRDLLSRVLEGSRISMFLGILTSFGSFALGILYALTAYALGGWKDQWMMRLVEVSLSLPSVITISVLVLFFSNIWVDRSLGTQLLVLALALSLSSWMWVARQCRTWIEAVRTQEFVSAAHAIGAKPARVIGRHILPQLTDPLLVFLGLQIPQNLLFESYLSFVGLGIQPPTASWGVLIQEGWRTLSVYPHLILVPSGFLFVTVLSFNLIFESWRKSLNPKLRR